MASASIVPKGRSRQVGFGPSVFHRAAGRVGRNRLDDFRRLAREQPERRTARATTPPSRAFAAATPHNHEEPDHDHGQPQRDDGPTPRWIFRPALTTPPIPPPPTRHGGRWSPVPDDIDHKDVRREIPDQVYAVIDRLCTQLGWRLRRQGHKFRLLGPCRQPTCQLSVSGTPRDADNEAKRLGRKARECERHHLPDTPDEA